VVAAEGEQSGCSGTETAIGSVAYDTGNDAVRAVFGKSRKRSALTYDVAVKEMADKNDAVAKAARAMAAAGSLKPATTVVVPPYTFPNRPTGPTKPDGFA
jgi:hypothetical protein